MRHIGAILWLSILYGLVLYIVLAGRSAIKKTITANITFLILIATDILGIHTNMYPISFIFNAPQLNVNFPRQTQSNDINQITMYIALILILIGLILIIHGWIKIYNGFEKQVKASRKLIKTGLYKVLRHPQYTGQICIGLGLLIGWLSLPTLIVFLLILHCYITLAKKEEIQMLNTYGDDYYIYKKHTKRFIPYIY